MAWIIWQAKTYASQLAGVGVEGAMQGAAAMGIGAGVFGASRMGRNMLGMGKNAGIGAWKGVRRQDNGFSQSPGVSGKLGNLTGQGVNIGAKRLRQAAIDMAKKMEDNFMDALNTGLCILIILFDYDNLKHLRIIFTLCLGNIYETTYHGYRDALPRRMPGVT
jgi:hypothetical protein